MKNYHMLVTLALVMTYGQSPAASQDWTMKSGGTLRKYRIHVPGNYSAKKPIPLVLMMHGRGGDGPGFEKATGMSDLADEKGFIVVYPTATQKPTSWITDWTPGVGGHTDLNFIKTLIKTIEGHYNIDKKRVFCAGFSSGAFMTYQLGASLSDQFAAIAVAEGTIGAEQPGAKKTIPNPSNPVSVLAFHGEHDTRVAYNGGPSRNWPTWNLLPVKESIAFWIREDGCNSRPSVAPANGGNVVCDQYAGGKRGTDVVLYSIGDGTHEWPDPATGIDAKNVVWTFFEKHPKR